MFREPRTFSSHADFITQEIGKNSGGITSVLSNAC